MQSSLSGFMSDSYFQIVNSISEVESLEDAIKLFLQVEPSVSNGTFYTKNLVPTIGGVDCVEGTTRFVNLDSLWYDVVYNQIMHNKELQTGTHKPDNAPGDVGIQYESGYADSSRTQIDGSWECVVAYDEILLAGDDMNDPKTIENPFVIADEWVNPFSCQLRYMEDDGKEIRETYDSFNSFVKKSAIQGMSRISINCILENKFFKFKFDEDGKNDDDNDILSIIPKCRYLVCLTNGFYGLELVKKENDFIGIQMYNLGEMIPNLYANNSIHGDIICKGSIGEIICEGTNGDVICEGQGTNDEYEFVNCSFNSVEDRMIMFLVLKERNSSKCHYLYLDDLSYDRTYGFKEIKQLITDQLIARPQDVFTQLDSFKQLDTFTIAMTNYGFWDVEENHTNDIVYSYLGTKNHMDGITIGNNREDKIVLPDFNLSDSDKVCEYDKVWELQNGRYVNGEVSYPQVISKNGTHDFVGGTDAFAIYDVTNNDDDSTAMMLVVIKLEQFKALMFSNPIISNLFMKYMYN